MDQSDVTTLLIRLKANKELLKKLSWRIIDVWSARECFFRYLDGDKGHASKHNLQPCTLYDVFVHFKDWAIDWERGLGDDEIALVSLTNWLDTVRDAHLVSPNDLRYRVACVA